MKRILLATLLMICLGLVSSLSAQAASLRVTPLEYRSVVAKGQKLKGVIDIANPSDKETMTVTVKAQAFRQINDAGELEFYDNPQIEAGLIPDLSTFEIAPKETQRMYFLVDGTKLPTGDIFGALMFHAKPKDAAEQAMINNSVRLGVLFYLTNDTPGERSAEITKLTVPFWQFGDNIRGAYSVKNTGDPEKASGFFPKVSLTLSPINKTTEKESLLVFPGRERSNDFVVGTNHFGFYQVTVGFGESKQTVWVFVAAWWQLALGVVLPVLLLLIGVFVLDKTRAQKRGKTKYFKAK